MTKNYVPAKDKQGQADEGGKYCQGGGAGFLGFWNQKQRPLPNC